MYIGKINISTPMLWKIAQLGCQKAAIRKEISKMFQESDENIQRVTRRCRLSQLTNSDPRIRAQMRGGVAGSQPMRTAVHIT